MKQIFFTFLIFLIGGAGVFAQRKISGKVTDAAGESMIGVTVVQKNTRTGTVSSADGRYEIPISEQNAVLVFTYTGYETKEIVVGNQTVIDVQIVESQSFINEVVVIGYGKQLRTTLTGNIAKIENDKVRSMPVVSIEQAMQGQAAGVVIESVNGKLGAAARVRVRGVGSISAGTEPLFVIDGVPLSKASRNTYGGDINPLADINFNDIESIEVLKDASAKSIYGSRGSNGVIIITTKSGKSGQSRVELDFQTGFSQPTGRREFLNAAEFVELFTEAANNSDDIDGYAYDDPDSWTEYVKSKFYSFSGENDDWMKKIDKTDWQEEALNNGSLRNTALTLSGGADRMRYYVSLNTGFNNGILVSNNLQKDNGRVNLDFDVNKKLKIGVNYSVSRNVTRQVSDDNAFSTPMQLVALSPLTPTRDPNGVLYDRPVTTYYNGLIDVEDAQRKVISLRTLTNAFANYSFNNQLSLRVEAAANLFSVRDEARFGERTDGGNATKGYGESAFAGATDYNTNAVLTWNNAFDEHSLGMDLGTEYFKNEDNRTTVFGEQFPTDELQTLKSAASITGGTGTLDEYSFLSYFARARYDFSKKYLFNASARVDGSSRFGADKKYAFFPAVSAGWILSEEDFLKDNKAFSFLKFRASWGQSGNADIGNYLSQGLFGTGSYNGGSAILPTQLANPNLTWEKSTEVDFGIDWGLFKNRITGEIDYYVRNADGLLQEVPVPSSSGFRTQWQNIGEVQNKGFEFVVNSNNTTGKFKWTTSLNLAFNKNEVKKLAEGQDIIDNGSNVIKVGEPIGSFYLAEYAGADPANGDALWYVNDPENPGVRADTNNFNAANFIIIGSPLPTLTGGIGNTLSYEGLTLDFRFQGVHGNKILRSGDIFSGCNACWFDNQLKTQLDRWQKPGDITQIPEARLGYSNGDARRSSRYISDGAYLRLKSVTLAYDLPTRLFSKIGIRTLRLYLTGTNLMTFTKYDGYDPEVTTDYLANDQTYGIEFYSAPQAKSFVSGVRIGF